MGAALPAVVITTKPASPFLAARHVGYAAAFNCSCVEVFSGLGAFISALLSPVDTCANATEVDYVSLHIGSWVVYPGHGRIMGCNWRTISPYEQLAYHPSL